MNKVFMPVKILDKERASDGEVPYVTKGNNTTEDRVPYVTKDTTKDTSKITDKEKIDSEKASTQENKHAFGSYIEAFAKYMGTLAELAAVAFAAAAVGYILTLVPGLQLPGITVATIGPVAVFAGAAAGLVMAVTAIAAKLMEETLKWYKEKRAQKKAEKKAEESSGEAKEKHGGIPVITKEEKAPA